MKPRLFAVLAALLLLLSAAPVRAARPLLDQHQWDRYFALFARDEYVPWRPVQVRLDTYSGAPVDLALYTIDPADVVIANGATVKERPLDLSHAQPIARWRFTPPSGYRYTSNEVSVPVDGREGFYVVEARRGDAAQQVWLDVSSAGMLAKSGPNGLFIYAADLRGGQPLAHMRLTFVVNGHFDTQYTDREGIYRWNSRAHPIFVLGEWGKSKPFLSLLPQAPAARSALVVRLDRDAARPGESVRVAGFARVRRGGRMVPAGGEVQVRLVGAQRAEAFTHAMLDADGAFSTELTLPRNVSAGEYAVLASGLGASGSAPLHVMPQSDGVSVSIDAPEAPATTQVVPVSLMVQRYGEDAGGEPVEVRVVRVPHARPPGYHGDIESAWGSSTIYQRTLRADDRGHASFVLQPPSDGLPSTYVVSARVGNAAAERVIVASSPDALQIVPERVRVAAGSPIRMEVRGFRVRDGAPTPGREVRVTLSHGVSVQEQTLHLDRSGTVTLAFSSPYLGGNLIVAQSGDAMDAAGVISAPQNLELTPVESSSSEISVSARREGGALDVDASLGGAEGWALLTLETGRVLDARVVRVQSERASGRLSLRGTSDNAAMGAAFVKDGALVWRDVASPNAGRLDVRVEPPAAPVVPASHAELRIHVGTGAPATAVVRIADEVASPGSSFGDAVALLAASTVTTQDTASEDAVWHTWATPIGSNVGDLFALQQRTQTAARPVAPQPVSARVYTWDVVRGFGGTLAATVAAPPQRGRYALSVLVISADGRVGSAAVNLEVQ